MCSSQTASNIRYIYNKQKTNKKIINNNGAIFFGIFKNVRIKNLKRNLNNYLLKNCFGNNSPEKDLNLLIKKLKRKPQVHIL